MNSKIGYIKATADGLVLLEGEMLFAQVEERIMEDNAL